MILHEILIIKGYTSRTIQLIRQIGSTYDTHLVTEVYNSIQKKWILLDPTFNLMFKSNANYINANQLRDIILHKKGTLDILENTKVKVAKYKEYYVDYFSLYNNVLIVRTNNVLGYKRIFAKLPILHNYIGRKYYVHNNNSGKGIGKLYKIFYFYISLFLLLNIVILILLKINNIKKVR
jgi:hypothetical protein